MKINYLNAIIAIGISSLITFGLYNVDSNVMKGPIGIGSFVLFSATLMQMIGVSFSRPKGGVSLSVVSVVFFVIALISNLLFSFFGSTIVSYIVVNGLIFFIFILISQSIYRAKQ